jgi:hypothetical protein
MARGELSYYKVRELTRVAAPATEDTLLMIAQHGSAHHVETVVRQFRRAKEAEELSREALQQANRFVSYHFDDDGSLVLKARLPAETGAVVLKALNVALEEVPYTSVQPEPVEVSENVPHGTSTVKLTPRMKRADALAIMAESFLQHGAEAMNGGDKYQIVVHVDKETLSKREGGRCELEDGASMTTETARRCSCDACIVEITEDQDGNPLNVGRKTRSISPILKRALNSRDKGCRFPGCCNKKYVDGHHIHHWANGGETKLSNLVTLCRFHHHLVHEGGVQIQILDDGAFRFVKPNGEAYSDCTSTFGRQEELLSFLPVTSHRSLVTPAQWRGDKMDYGLAVQVLCQRDAQGRNVPGGTFCRSLRRAPGLIACSPTQATPPPLRCTNDRASNV